VYADGKGTAYTYTPDGKLATRTWARGVTTSYDYDDDGARTSIGYSADTPGVVFQYDRMVRQVSVVTNGVSTKFYVYCNINVRRISR
jgi:YD repeat-containing protein